MLGRRHRRRRLPLLSIFFAMLLYIPFVLYNDVRDVVAQALLLARWSCK